MVSAASLEDALVTLGELLEERSLSAELVVIGGGSLLLLGVLQRPTKDLDVFALLEHGTLLTAQPLPKGLSEAVADVGVAQGLAPDWLNSGPTSLLDFGLPDGFQSRLSTRSFGTLTLHVAGRFDQVREPRQAAASCGS
ncbi:MAG: DUF6036 family nucleotidyltransferase [Polyangiaceae bacterium]|nr:DUF6036 family nucleotidyltransferase [Polyangiaceae bacterium]